MPGGAASSSSAAAAISYGRSASGASDDGTSPKAATSARGGDFFPRILRRPPHFSQATLSPPDGRSDEHPPPAREPGLQFLPHTLIPPRRPPPVPAAEVPMPVPGPEPETEPAKSFRVPIPRNLPPGPWLPQDIIPVVSRPVDAGDQNAPLYPNPRRNPPFGNQKFGFDSSNRRNPGNFRREKRTMPNGRGGYWSDGHGGPDEYSRRQMMHSVRRHHLENLPSSRWVHRRPSDSEKQNAVEPARKPHQQRVRTEWVVKRRQDEKDNLQEMNRSDHETGDDTNGDSSADSSSDNGGIQSDFSAKEQQINNQDEQNECAISFEGSDVDEGATVEGDSSEAELGNPKEFKDLASEKHASTEEDVLAEQLIESTKLTSDLVGNNVIRPPKASMIQISRSDSFKRQPGLSQWRRIDRRHIACRTDIETLTAGLLSVYQSLIPAEEEKGKQNQLLHSLAKSVKKEWPDAQLYLYGSSANTFGFSSSDLDICLVIDDSKMKKHEMLLKLADILQLDEFQDVEAVTHARVPIVKMIDPETGIACDICINNLLAVANTKLLKDYAKIDERLHQLASIVKHWAKSRGLNNTYRGTLSSYAYVLMCIHFLQLRKPAILPCLQEIEATYTLTIDDIQCAYYDNVETLRTFGAQNKESLAQLVWEFFHYWAYRHDYKNHVISVRTGRFISKQLKNWVTRIGNDRHLLSIEDPFETSHDLGRRVDKHNIQILREEFQRAAYILQHEPNPGATLFEQFITDSNTNLINSTKP